MIMIYLSCCKAFQFFKKLIYFLKTIQAPINKMNTSTKLVTLFSDTYNDYIDKDEYSEGNCGLTYNFNLVKGKYYKLTIREQTSRNRKSFASFNIIILFDKIIGITYNYDAFKIKIIINNNIEEHNLFDYTTDELRIFKDNSKLSLAFDKIKSTNTKLIVVLEKIIDEEVVEKTEEQPDLLDLENEDERPINILKKVKISGKSYLKSENDILYDPVTEEILGFWDPTTNQIIKANDDYDDI